MDNSSLTSHQLKKALEILNREQRINIPTFKEVRRFDLYSVAVYAFTTVYLLHLFIHFQVIERFLLNSGTLKWLSDVLYYGLYVFEAATIVLLVLNFGLIRKLLNQVRLRNKLKIRLKDSIEYQTRLDKNNRVLFLEKMQAIIGVAIVLFEIYNLLKFFGVYGGAVATPFSHDGQWPPLNYIVARVLGPLILGPSMVIRYLIRLGRHRIQTVNHLHQEISKYKVTSEANENKIVDISSKQYDQLARLERSQIVCDLRQSSAKEFKQVTKDQYVVQKSQKMRQSLEQLDEHTRTIIDNRIIQLVENPLVVNTDSKKEGEFLTLPVPNSNYKVIYKIDSDSKRIKIYYLNDTANPAFNSTE